MTVPVPPEGCCCRERGTFCGVAWAVIAARNNLTPHQVEVARLLAAGKTEYQIARALGTTESAIHGCIQRLATKLEASGHVEAVEELSLTHHRWRSESPPDPPPPAGCPWGRN